MLYLNDRERKGKVMFKQSKFNKLMFKINRLIKDLSQEELEIVIDNYHSAVVDLPSRLMPIPPRKMELIKPEVDMDAIHKPGDIWTIDTIVGMIRKYMKCRDSNTGRYNPSVKRNIAYQYGIEEKSISNRVNTYINDALKEDKYGLLSGNYFTREELVLWKYRDNKVRKNMYEHNLIPDEDLEILRKEYYL